MYLVSSRSISVPAFDLLVDFCIWKQIPSIGVGMDNQKVAETHMTSPAAFVEGGVQEACDDACSICLEPFSDSDPATITSCKHEYHLQCILEWSQRSKECPMCWQLLSLKDPASQELLAAVEQERTLRLSRSPNSPMFPRSSVEEFEFHHVPAYADDSDFEERIMQHLAAAAMGRAHRFSRRENLRNRSSNQGHPQYLVFSTPSNAHGIPTSVSNNSGPQAGIIPSLNVGDSPVSVLSASREEQQQGSLPSSPGQVSSHSNLNSGVATQALETRSDSFPPRHAAGQPSVENQQRSRSSEFQSFSESLKSRFNAVSSRYKESISKSTRGFREKLWARNSAVTELGREVQREVSAGIAGVARMMERLDPTMKNNGMIASGSDDMEGTSAVTPVRPPVEGIQNSVCSKGTAGSSSRGTSSGLSMPSPQPLSDKSDSCTDVASLKDVGDSSGGEGSMHQTAAVSSPA